MANIINATVPLCGLSVFVHSITLRRCDQNSKYTTFPHRHPGFEIHGVTAGTCRVKCSGETYTLDPHTALLLPPEIYHNVADDPLSTERISMCFSLDMPEDRKQKDKSQSFYRAFGCAAPLLLPLRNPELSQLLKKMKALLQDPNGDPYGGEKLLTLFCQFLLELAGQLEQGKSTLSPPSAGDSAEGVDFLIDTFLATNFMHNDAMPRMAQQLHVSTRQLHRIIREHYGTNYRQKLAEIRIKIAMDMLCNTDVPIHKIGELLGYSSSANFSTFIKHYTHKTPSQIRKNRDL